jgi:predicted dehydrogenase
VSFVLGEEAMKQDAGHRSEKLDRRGFLAAASTAAVTFSVVPSHVLGGPGRVPPSEKINVAYIGVGTQGTRQLMQALPHEELKITCVCDPNADSTDYVEWGRNEIRDKVRAFLKRPNWGAGVAGCRCGREMGREIVESWYGMNTPTGRYSGCATYSDFRELLDKEKDLDALYVMTPEHLHGTIALAAMNRGKHVIQHKTLANVLHEARLARDTARRTGVATHMFCSADNRWTATICEWLWAGAIGDVREVHNWSTRPFWPQGMMERPKEQLVPQGMDWDLWLGPVPHVSYSPAYTHAVFRGWYDFGSGALGDMGNYSFFQIWKILKLGTPTSVEARRDQYWAIIDNLWKKQQNAVSFPRASTIRFEFPAREDLPPVTLAWYDGGLRPPIPAELEQDGEPMPDEGLLFVGDRGKLLCGFSGDNPRLIPRSRMAAYTKPPETLPRPIGELDQWIRACRGGQASDASYENVYPFAETISLGNVALRIDKKLYWDSAEMQFTNSPEANKLLRRPEYRKGWEL